MQKCKTVEGALFYIKRTIGESLSRNALDNCIRVDMYRVMGAAVTNFNKQLPAPQGKLAQEMLKENCNLGFISLPKEYDETALKTLLNSG